MSSWNTSRRFGVLAALVFCSLFSKSSLGAPGWADGIESGVEKAKQSGKPLFVVFRCVR